MQEKVFLTEGAMRHFPRVQELADISGIMDAWIGK